jgi:ATP-binding cassette subfamily B protein
VLRLAVFNVVPTVIEPLLVTAIIWHLFDWRFAAITFGACEPRRFPASFATWRSRIRRAMNDQDNDASTKALDSLLNYETVKYFGNEPHEVARYDAALAHERAAVRAGVAEPAEHRPGVHHCRRADADC